MNWYLVGILIIVTVAAFLFALGLCKAAANADVGGNQQASALASPRPDVPESGGGFGAAAATTETPSRPDLTTAGSRNTRPVSAAARRKDQ